MLAYTIVDSPIGPLTVTANERAVTYLSFSGVFQPGARKEFTSVLRGAAAQLAEYFKGTRREFDLPLEYPGTPFQESVWNALRAIPYGETRSYLDIAVAVGNPKACRAVGAANGKNPIALIIPCHRVIGSNGSLTGFGGGLDVKDRLLALEKRP